MDFDKGLCMHATDRLNNFLKLYNITMSLYTLIKQDAVNSFICGTCICITGEIIYTQINKKLRVTFILHTCMHWYILYSMMSLINYPFH